MFDEADVNRTADGKFSVKQGSAPDIALPALSPTREAALNEVFDSGVKEFFPLSRKPGAKKLYKTSDHRTVSRPALEWLMSNGYVHRATGPNLRGTPLAPTEAAQAAREKAEAKLAAAGQKKCAKCVSPSVRPDGYEPLCSKHYMASINDAQQAASARFEEHVRKVAAAKSQIG